MSVDFLELAHRVGKRISGKDRQIIFKLTSRFQKSILFKSRKVLRDGGVLIFDDLCHPDFEEKKRLNPVMLQAFRDGHRVAFRNGKLYIDGSVYNG